MRKISSLFNLGKSNAPLILVGVAFIFFIVLIFKKTGKKQNIPSKHNYSSSTMSLPESQKQVSLYNTKMEAYREEKRKKRLHRDKKLISFPSIDSKEDIEDTPLHTIPKLVVPKKEPSKIVLKPISKKHPTVQRSVVKNSVKHIKEDREEEDKIKQKEKRRKAFEDYHKKRGSSKKGIILAEINKNQTIGHGKEISFQLLEDVIIDDVTIPAYSVIYGRAIFNSHRIDVNFSSIIYQDQLIPFERALYDFDGFKGIALHSNKELQDRSNNIEDEVLNVDQYIKPLSDNNYISKGVSTIKKVFSKGSKKAYVELISGHRVLLKQISKK